MKQIIQDKKSLKRFFMMLVVAVVATVCMLSPSWISTFTFTTSGGVDNLDVYTKIVCSNGNIYEATFANLQTVALLPGRHYLPSNTNITFSGSPLRIGNNTELIGYNTTFFADANFNNHMVIMNYSHNNTLSGIIFDLNNVSQNPIHPGSSYWGNLSVIFMKGACDNIITNCRFIRGYGSYIWGYYLVKNNNNMVDECHFYAKSLRRKYTGGASDWTGTGAIYFSGNNNIIKNNFIEDTKNCGIIIHGSIYVTPYPKGNIIDSNIIIGDIAHGIHTELSDNTTITHNMIGPLNSSAYLNFDSANSYSSGILISGHGNDVGGNYIYSVGFRGIDSQDGNNTIHDNRIYEVENNLYIRASPGDIITGNKIVGTLVTSRADSVIKGGSIIKDNTITISGSAFSSYCIYISSPRTIVSGNNCSGSYDLIRLDVLASNSIVTNNILMGGTHSNFLNGNPTGCIVKNNIGYVTESSGNRTVVATTALTSFVHNLSMTPHWISITIGGNSTCTNGNEGFNCSMTATKIWVGFHGKLAGNCKIYWEARSW